MESRGNGPLEIVEQQNAIIRIQSGVIDELFLLSYAAHKRRGSGQPSVYCQD